MLVRPARAARARAVPMQCRRCLRMCQVLPHHAHGHYIYKTLTIMHKSCLSVFHWRCRGWDAEYARSAAIHEWKTKSGGVLKLEMQHGMLNTTALCHTSHHVSVVRYRPPSDGEAHKYIIPSLFHIAVVITSTKSGGVLKLGMQWTSSYVFLS